MTAELAKYFAEWLREMVPQAPSPLQRDRIEWLLERDTGRFYVIDFNARPFMSLGHLTDCGLNLPALTYAELIGQLPEHLPLVPALRPSQASSMAVAVRTSPSLVQL